MVNFFGFRKPKCAWCGMKLAEQVYEWQDKNFAAKTASVSLGKRKEKGWKQLSLIKILGILLPTFLFSLIFLSNFVYAHCPLCTAATGLVVATTRWYGIDDLVVGIFFGGFTISTAVWINNVLRRRNKGKNYIPGQEIVLILLALILTFLTFYFAGLLGSFDPAFTIFGIDKILIGTLIGSATTLIAFRFQTFLKSFNNGKNFIPFQTIVVTLAFLSITALGLYALGLASFGVFP